ncbi:MAG: hypothetical protein WAT21_03870, partial [Saprospiraceae bacterium]
YIKPKNWIDKIRNNITKNTSLLILKEKLRNHLNTIDISSLEISKDPLEFTSKPFTNYDKILCIGNGLDTSIIANCEIFEKQEELSKYIIHSILPLNPSTKILVVIGCKFVSRIDSSQSDDIFHKMINDYKVTLEVDIAKSNSWFDLYAKSENFILSEEEHEYNHPSAYHYIIAAALHAIKDAATQDMYDRMRLDCPNKEISSNICRLKDAHYRIWNKVLSGLITKDDKALIELRNNLFIEWDKFLKNGVVKKPKSIEYLIPIQVDLCKSIKYSCSSNRYLINGLPDGFYDIYTGENHDLHTYNNIESKSRKLEISFQKPYNSIPSFKVIKIKSIQSGMVYYCND